MTKLSAHQLDALLPSLVSVREIEEWEAARRGVAGNALAERATSVKAAAARRRVKEMPHVEHLVPPRQSVAEATEEEARAAALLAGAYSLEQVLDLVYQFTEDEAVRYAAIAAAEIVLGSGEPAHVLELYRLLDYRPRLRQDLTLLGMISRT